MWWAALAVAGTWEVVEARRDDDAPVVTDLARRAELAAFFADVTANAAMGREAPHLDDRAAALSLTVDREEDVLRIHGRGDGLVAVRLGEDVAPLVLVTPHAWHDLGTGSLSSEWFDDGYARALVINTTHRDRGVDEDAVRDDADVAHLADSGYQALVLGVVDGLVDPLVVEVHGFSERRGDYGAVVADGDALQQERWAEAVAALIAPHVEGPVAPGEDVWRLAATKNIQGRAISGQARFVHLELSRPARRAFRRDPIRRSAVGSGLARLAEAE